VLGLVASGAGLSAVFILSAVAVLCSAGVAIRLLYDSRPATTMPLRV
jgi:hypothetical protein